MRDINRLDNFYEKVKEGHKIFPDWRFGQLMLNFMSWFVNKYKRDIFYIEDDKFLIFFNEFINEMEG